MNSKNREVLELTWCDFGILVDYLIERIKADGRKFDSVYGIPRNGSIVAAIIAKILNLRLVEKPDSVKTLIVDDISDTGKTLRPLKISFASNVIATIHYREDTEIMPDIVVEDAKDKWIQYPWEKYEQRESSS